MFCQKCSASVQPWPADKLGTFSIIVPPEQRTNCQIVCGIEKHESKHAKFAKHTLNPQSKHGLDELIGAVKASSFRAKGQAAISHGGIRKFAGRSLTTPFIYLRPMGAIFVDRVTLNENNILNSASMQTCSFIVNCIVIDFLSQPRLYMLSATVVSVVMSRGDHWVYPDNPSCSHPHI